MTFRNEPLVGWTMYRGKYQPSVFSLQSSVFSRPSSASRRPSSVAHRQSSPSGPRSPDNLLVILSRAEAQTGTAEDFCNGQSSGRHHQPAWTATLVVILSAVRRPPNAAKDLCIAQNDAPGQATKW